MQQSLSRAGLIARHADGADRPQTKRYFGALSADGSLRQVGGPPIPGCYADPKSGTAHGHMTFSGAGLGGERGG
jgi:hypothetical protein